MALNVDSLRKSIAVLHRSLEVAQAHKDNEVLKDTLRSGVIQNFEVSYEQCWKMMKRWLEVNISSNSVAENVYAATHDFARDALRFLQALEARND